jgi:group I intron endonuclease
MGYIYMVENKTNGKKYVGQTKCADIETRWRQHKKIDKRSLGTCLYNAYNKYGISNFVFKILCICFDEDTNTNEIYYIKKYNTIYPNGYNLQEGGNNRKHNPCTIEQIRNSLKGEKSINFGKHLPLETRQKISESLRGSKHPKFNKKMSEEQKDKIRQTIVSYSDEKRKEINKKIVESLKLNRNNNNNKTQTLSKLSKKIAQCNLDGSIIKIFDSISHAARELNTTKTTISRCCSDKYIHYKTCKGFLWKYYDN